VRTELLPLVDDKEKETIAGPSYAYPRFSTRCMADTIELSRDVRDDLALHPLRAGRMEILTSACDKGANSEQTNQLASQWQQKDPGRVSIYEFPETLGVPHDMIDPNQPDAKTQITYSKVLELLRVNPPGNAVGTVGAFHALSRPSTFMPANTTFDPANRTLEALNFHACKHNL
jgi:hypothetical protein